MYTDDANVLIKYLHTCEHIVTYYIHNGCNWDMYAIWLYWYNIHSDASIVIQVLYRDILISVPWFCKNYYITNLYYNINVYADLVWIRINWMMVGLNVSSEILRQLHFLLLRFKKNNTWPNDSNVIVCALSCVDIYIWHGGIFILILFSYLHQHTSSWRKTKSNDNLKI